MSFSKATIKSTCWLRDDDSGEDVLHVYEPHALVMAVGYLKFKFGNSDGEGIYLRGQRKLYGSLIPSLYRGISTVKAQNNKNAALVNIINRFTQQNRIFEKFSEYAHESLLQHYGIFTSWIDLVDNVWVALWFACHRAVTCGKANEFMHFERRTPSDKERFAYILLVVADIDKKSHCSPGILL